MDYDYKEIFNNLNKVDGIIVANPNNPDGRTVLKEEEFKTILDYCEQNNKLVIIDEAFIEFLGRYINKSFVDKIRKYKCLFIIRALTKFYAMPEYDLDLELAKMKKIIEKIKSMQNPWNIKCFAEVAAKYVLKRWRDILRNLLKWITKRKRNLLEEIRKIEFIEKAYDTHGNFILCKLKRYRLWIII